jgi:hypothetical protein
MEYFVADGISPLATDLIINLAERPPASQE